VSGQDDELERLRSGVNCATLLEKLVPGWTLDQRESTKRALKYRRGSGEILIINHDGRGWWDRLSEAKGDVFDLVRHYDRRLCFGQVRRVLRRFVGVAPSYPCFERPRRGNAHGLSREERWEARRRLHRGSPTWPIWPRPALCRRAFCQPPRRPMRCARGPMAAPGSPIGTTTAN
jgi:hypothetical protein